MKLTVSDIGPLQKLPNGATVRPLGPLTLLVRAPWKALDGNLVAVMMGDGPRIGRPTTSLSSIGMGTRRFSAELWDERRARWTKRRAFDVKKLLGVVSPSDRGLSFLGIPVVEPSPIVAPASGLVIPR